MTEPMAKLGPTPLLHSWEGAIQQQKGLFTLGDGQTIPAAWEPRPEHYDPKAIPTPFARAEAMRLILQHIDEAAGHAYATRFRYLLLGIASGVLTLEPDSLGHDKYDNLGRALLQVDEDARYFCQILWLQGGRRRSFGVTYRSSLFSPHARRAAEEWSELADAVRPKEKRALELLAAWRAMLQAANRWAPGLRHCEWQRGVDHVLGDHPAPPDSSLLQEHARWVGPVWLAMPTGRADEPVQQGPLYLPAFAPDFARRFNQACGFRPRVTADHTAIAFVDAGNQELARIRLPQAGTDPQQLALGLGLLELHDVPITPSTTVEDWVRGAGGDARLIELLRPVELALHKLGRRVEPAQVAACPALYPDPIRILVERKLWPVAGGERATESRALTDARLKWGGRALDQVDVEHAGGAMLSLGGDGARVGLVMVDRVAIDRLGAFEVNDLRALGFVLWSVFVRDAEVSAELAGQLAISDTLEKLLEHTADRPLEPTRRVYDRVAAAPPESLRRRLATQQRFMRAYSGGDSAIARLLSRAARSFTRWASGRDAVEHRLGRPVLKFIKYRLPTGEDLQLATDALET